MSHFIRMERDDDTIRASQRFKRMERIMSKLGRLSTRLSPMENIGGCRAVLENRDQVYGVAVSAATMVISRSSESVPTH